MSEPQGTATGDQGQQESSFKQIFSVVQRVLFFYAISQLIIKFTSKPQVDKPPPVPSNFDPADTPQVQSNPFHLPPKSASPAWPLGAVLDMHVYLTTSPVGDIFSQNARRYRVFDGLELPHFSWTQIQYGSYSESREISLDVHLPTSVKNNGSLWADIFLTKDGANPNPAHSNFNPASVHHVRKLLTRYLPRTKLRKERKLLSGGNETEPEADEPDTIVSHWHKNLTLALVSDANALPYTQLSPPVLDHVHLLPGARDQTGAIGFYNPIIFPNDFWHLRSQHAEINDTTPVLPLQVTFQPMTFFKFQMFATLSAGFSEAAKSKGSSNAELDEIKRMLVETNPWFLGLTGIVSILHVVFEMLAFKNDVSHWRKKNELVGVSLRTIVTNVFVQIIILLYLVDNNTDTSWMILMGQGVGIVIEAWKITKAVDIKVIPSTGSAFPYKLDIKDKHVLSEDEKKTQQYDKLAFRYVSYFALPCLLGYTIYSLLYNSHRGWYSFVISTLTSFVYMFGFVQLVPQLIINYKLKSVAHMPMKAMIYKTLSTVVDDLFAFCIKMPLLHRLACFRDDVVFLVFLYQRWIYRIDPKRVNEYGQVLTTDVELVDKKGESKKTK